MEDLFINRLNFEKCQSDKRVIDVVMAYTSLHYIVDGYGYFNGVKLGKGQFFCLIEHEKVCYYPDKNEPWSYYYVDISGSEVRGELKKLGLICDAPYGNMDVSNEIEALHKLYRTYTSKGNENYEFSKAVAKLVLSLHDIDIPKNNKFSAVLAHVNEIKNYIEHNFHQKITIEEISRKFYLSRGYVRNIFFEYMNMSPKAYLQKLRMEKAAELIADTDYSVYEISKAVGYDDQLLFSKMFKKYHGVSPLVFRNAR